MKKLEIEAKTHHKTNYHKQTIIKQTNQKIRFGLALNSQTKQMTCSADILIYYVLRITNIVFVLSLVKTNSTLL